MKYSEMHEEAQKVKALKTLTPTYFEFEKKGDAIVGRYKGRSPVTSSLGSGEYFQYLFDTDDGLIKIALGQATDKEAGQLLESGKVYVVEYLGQVKISGGRKVNKFDVQVIDETKLSGFGEEEEEPEGFRKE